MKSLISKGRNNSLRHQMRRTWARLRGNHPNRLPDFLVIGASRSGTTTLNRLLGSHPDIFVPPGRELHYFDNDALYREDLSGYRELFAGYRGQRLIGEVMPSYCDKGTVYDLNGKTRIGVTDDPIRRIARAMPHCRLIISLRDPLARITARYFKNFYQGKTSRSLEEELRAEASGTSALRLVSRCQYCDTVQACLAQFPKTNLKVLVFEEWTSDQATAASELFSFLGIDSTVCLRDHASNNANRYRKAIDSRILDGDLSPEMRDRVVEATKASRVWLEHFLGRELPWVTA